MPLSAQSCNAVFDAFLHHESARVARGDLAPITLASHRQILDHVWRPHLGPLPFLGVRHSQLVTIADAAAHLTNRSRPAAAPTSAIDLSVTGPARGRFGSRLGTGPEQPLSNYLKVKENSWRRGWDSNPRAGITRPSDFESAPL